MKHPNIIGKGAYGHVYKLICKKTAHQFALKYHCSKPKEGIPDTTVRELSCLSALKGHPNVVQLTDCFIESYNGNDLTVAMLMPYIPYTLNKVIHNGYGLKAELHERFLPLSFVANFSVQVAQGLAYMHRLNMIHRDLTPYNVLLTQELTVQLADMGLSRQSCKWMSPELVTEHYRAPELFTECHSSQYTCAIDMWSLGVLIGDAMEGRPVFSPGDSKSPPVTDIFTIIAKTLCPRDHPLSKCLPYDVVSGWAPESLMPNTMACDQVKSIVLKLLAFSGNERLLAHELLQDKEWLETTCMTTEDKDVVRERISEMERSEESCSIDVPREHVQSIDGKGTPYESLYARE